MTREDFFLKSIPLSYKLFNKIITCYLNNFDKVTCRFNISTMNYEFSLNKSMIVLTSFNNSLVSLFFYPDVSKPYITSGITAYSSSNAANTITEEEKLYSGCTALIDFAERVLTEEPRINEFQNLTAEFINKYTKEEENK